MTDTDRGTPSVPPWVVDVSMAVAVSTVLISVVALSQVGTDHVPSLASYLFVAAFGVVLLVRRQLPRTVLAVSVLGTFAYYVLEYPPIGVALPVAGALFSTAERGRLGWAVGGGSVVFAVSLYFRLRDDPNPSGTCSAPSRCRRWRSSPRRSRWATGCTPGGVTSLNSDTSPS